MLNGLNILPSYTDYFHLNAATTGLNTASVFIGGFFGPMFGGVAADRLGRRPAIFWGSVVTIVGIILQTAAQSVKVIHETSSGLKIIQEHRHVRRSSYLSWFWYRCLRRRSGCLSLRDLPKPVACLGRRSSKRLLLVSIRLFQTSVSVFMIPVLVHSLPPASLSVLLSGSQHGHGELLLSFKAYFRSCASLSCRSCTSNFQCRLRSLSQSDKPDPNRLAGLFMSSTSKKRALLSPKQTLTATHLIP